MKKLQMFRIVVYRSNRLEYMQNEEKLRSLLPTYRCKIIWNIEKQNKCETCSENTDSRVCDIFKKRIVVNEIFNALKNKVIIKEDLIRFIDNSRKHVCSSCDLEDVERFEKYGYNNALTDVVKFMYLNTIANEADGKDC